MTRKKHPHGRQSNCFSLIKISKLLLIFAVLSFSCRKSEIDKISPIESSSLSSFFDLHAVTNPSIKEFAIEIQRQNAAANFLNYFIESNGYLLWKSSFEKKTSEGVIALIPFANGNEIRGFIVAKKSATNNFSFSLYKKKNVKFDSGKNNQVVNTALSVSNPESIINLFNSKVYNIKQKIYKNSKGSTDTRVNKEDESRRASINNDLNNNSLNNIIDSSSDFTNSCITVSEETEWWWNPDGDGCNCSGDEYYMYSTFDLITICVEDGGGPNPVWWIGSGDSGSGGGGAPYGIDHGWAPELVMPMVYDYLAEQLNLTTTQSVWLDNNWKRAKEIFDFLFGSYTPEKLQIVIEHLNEMMINPSYYTFVLDHEATGNNSLMWWQDVTWMNTHFIIDINSDVINAPTEGPNSAELILVNQYPIQAFKIFKNANIARNESNTRYPTSNQINDKADAFRHAYWNALNTRSVGLEITILFGEAHEYGTPSKFQLEKDMDLHNNGVGRVIGINNRIPQAELANTVSSNVQSGACKYLSPINYTDPCFWQCTGNPTGTHGIGQNTTLLNTNQ